MSESSTDTLLDVREVARRLSISPRTVWTQAARGDLPAPIRIGRLSRWRWDTILRWIEEKELVAEKQQERLAQISS